MFVAASNFAIDPYKIPNLDKLANSFTIRSEAKEKEALLKLLGRQLYGAFIAGLPDHTYSASVATVIGDTYGYGNDVWEALTVTTGTLPIAGSDWTLIEEDSVWLKLKNGSDYTYAGKTWHWEGMAALLTPYVYAMMVREDEEIITGIGAVESKSENSTRISAASKICTAYNAYSNLFGHLSDGCFSSEDTLYGFLSVNEADYEDWYFTPPGKMNTLGI